MQISGRRTIHLFLLPITVYLIIFFLYPVLFELYISFFDYSLGSPKKFIGIKNYLAMLKDEEFIISLRITSVFVVSAVFCQLTFGLLIAILLNHESRIMNIIRTLILIPTVFTPLVAGLVWKALLHPDLGPVTYYLRQLGINIGRGLTVERSTALFSIVMIDVWEWTPLMVIIILAGLKSLPEEPYEAGRIDGASAWHLFRYITLPLLRPTVVVALLIRTLDALKIFDIIWAITRGGPGTATTVANIRIYDVGLQHLRIGYASSLSNVLLVIGILIGVLFVNVLYSRKYGGIR
ncbi:MAG: sugar ABC transporter permease [Spirochaetes bacterium]|nr:MAG: sugar ABC transporter permease [Spirochaetota bacterium]